MLPAGQTHSSDRNLRHAMNLVFFEQWLRFYFITEEDGTLFLRVPAEDLEKAKRLHPDLFPMALSLNNREINHMDALNALCDGMMSEPYVLNGMEWVQVLAGKEFRLTLHLLSFWLQAEEDALDARVLPFTEWRGRFMVWREQPSIKDYAARLRDCDDFALDFPTQVQ